jgi:restriction system protein
LKFKMAEKSIFAILLRSPWWISFVIAIAFGLIARLWLPERYQTLGALSGLPFAVIGLIAAWKQFRAPSTAHVADTLDQVATLSWRDFSSTLERAFVRDGHEVQRLDTQAADFVISKSGRTTLVSGKRWKAARLGLEPFQSLEAERIKQDANYSMCISTGQITDNALSFIKTKSITVIQGTELAQLVRSVLPAKKP